MDQRKAIQNWRDPAAAQSWSADRVSGNRTRAEQLDMVATLLETFQEENQRILDLGCGDGVVAEMLLQRLPGSFVVCVDSSPPMLAAASERLAPYTGRYSLVFGELENLAALELHGPFDSAIGIQSIHHLDALGKQELFTTVAALLRPGGFCLLSDRVMLDSAALFPLQLALYSRQQQKNGGPPVSASYGYAAHLQANSDRGDVPDTVEDQLEWLRAAGFGESACFYSHVERAIFGGLKQEPGPRKAPFPDDHSAEQIFSDDEHGC